MSMTDDAAMTVDLAGRTYRLIGNDDAVSGAVAAALSANGAQASGSEADILIAATPLLPDSSETGVPLPAVAEIGRSMAAREGGRIVFLLSALGGLPMRRHVDYSAAMAAAVAGMRGLAMALGPHVLVNAVGAGVIEQGGELLAGDRRMLTHASLGRAGTIADITNAVLFLCDPMNTYTTGQLLTVDGGWSVGYGRNF